MTLKVYNNCIHRLNLRKVTPAVNLAIIALAIIPCVSAQESIQHELPIVTHWSNETKAFEYMASDMPDYRVPAPDEKYRPGDSYYYYREGNSNFLPDLNNYVGMNFSLKTVGEEKVKALAESVVNASGVALKFYRPDAFTVRNAPTRLKDAPGYVQVVHAKIIKTSEDDPGCLATFFLPPNWKSDAPEGTYPIITVGHYDLNDHVFLPTPNGRGDAFGTLVARSGIEGRTGAIGVIWNGGGAWATYTANPRAFRQFGKIIDYVSEELGGNRHCVMATGNSRSGITAVGMASNPLNLDYTMKFISAGSFASNRDNKKLSFSTSYPKQLMNLCRMTGFHDSWKPGWKYPATDGIHVQAGDINQDALVNTHLIGKDAFEVAGYVQSGTESTNPDWNPFSDKWMDGILDAGTAVFLEVRTNDILPHFNMLEYANKLEEKMKEKGDVRLHVDYIARAGHAFRRTPQGTFVLNDKLWDALSQFVDPTATEGPLVEPGKGYFEINRETLSFEKVNLTDGMHPFAMDVPVGIMRGDTIALVCTGEPGTTYRVEISPEEGLDAPGFEARGVIAADITMRGVSFVDIPLQQPIGKYQYRLWIKKPGQEEVELDKSHSVTGQEVILHIWDEKLADNIVSGDELWRETYGQLLPKKLGPVIAGFTEDQASLIVDKTPFIAAKTSDPGITTHEITSGNVTLGITDKGGGMINKFTLPGYGDIMDDFADRYGRGGQTAVRSLGHSHKYNPTQAGLTDQSGTQCNITATTGRLVVDKRPCCLWRGDNQYDFIEWEDLCSDNYNDGGTSGHNSDVDGIDETNLPGKQAEEITSEFDFYCVYQDYMDSSGVDIPCFYHYYEMEYSRYPGHCIDQFGEGTSVWDANQIVDDISVNAPSGTHQGTDQDMNTFTHWTTLRTDNDLWAGDYRHTVLVSGAWYTEARTAKAQAVVHIAGAEVFPLLIISNSTDINAGPAIGVFQPNSDIVAQQTVGGTYTDDRRKPRSAWVQDDPDRAGQNKFGFGGRTWGLLNRNRTPNNDPEKWRGEMYFLVGTPAEIYANALKLNAEWATGNLPSAPTGLSLSTGETSCDLWVTASWTANAASDSVTVYEVWRSTAAGGTYDYLASSTGTSYTDGGLDPNKEYFYKIKAASQAGTSAYSSKQSTTTLENCISYSLTIHSGTGGGSYPENTQVSITANVPTSGNVFDQWTGDVANVADVNAATTTITMPAEAVELTATYTPTTSIDKVRTFSKDAAVQLYPNPARGIVIIETTEAFEVVVFDVVGQIMYNKQDAATSCNIDVRNWKSGVYYVNIQCAGKVFNKKLVVE